MLTLLLLLGTSTMVVTADQNCTEFKPVYYGSSESSTEWTYADPTKWKGTILLQISQISHNQASVVALNNPR
jgi:hypothetical protein